MSYSFTAKASSKQQAKDLIAENFENVVATQGVHAADRSAAVACGQAFVDVLTAEPGENEEIQVSMYGSLGWRGTYLYVASVHVDVQIRAKG